jgi:hypothetical protein
MTDRAPGRATRAGTRCRCRPRRPVRIGVVWSHELGRGIAIELGARAVVTLALFSKADVHTFDPQPFTVQSSLGSAAHSDRHGDFADPTRRSEIRTTTGPRRLQSAPRGEAPPARLPSTRAAPRPAVRYRCKATASANATTNIKMITGTFQIRSFGLPAPQCMHGGSWTGVCRAQAAHMRRGARGSRKQRSQRLAAVAVPQNGHGIGAPYGAGVTRPAAAPRRSPSRGRGCWSCPGDGTWRRTAGPDRRARCA